MYKLVRELIKYLNEINNNCFTKEELKEFAKDYIYIIKNNESDIIVNVLKEEYKNSKDIKALEFINRLASIN